MGAYREVFQRKEIKYLLNGEQYEGILRYLHTIAKEDEYGQSRINNIYYDTPDFRLIRMSLEKPVYKEKLRLRTYGETKDGTNAFLEIKKKYDGIVYKRRISGSYNRLQEYMNGGNTAFDDSQIAKEIRAFREFYKNLQPAMCICYERVAMAGIYDPDFRVTFDTKIEWNAQCRDLREIRSGKPLLRPDECLMEIKAANAYPLKLARQLSEWEIFPASFSKYGAGYTEMRQTANRGNAAENRNVRSIRYRKGEMAYV